jgi:hypothetical protein
LRAGAGEDRFPPSPRTEAARQAVGRRAFIYMLGLRAGAGDMDKL